MYSPQAAGAYMHSAVIPEAAIGQAWNTDVSLDTTPSPWLTSTQNLFLNFDYSSAAVSSFQSQDTTTWTRTTYMIHANDNYPLILIADSFSGPGADKPMVSSLNLMSAPNVSAPGGTIIPSLRANLTSTGNQQDLPSGGIPQALPAGNNLFHFTGQWLIDWDLYTMTDAPSSVIVGNWAHDWAPDAERQQFQQSQNRPFREMQDILRLRAVGTMQFLVLPYRKTEARNAAVTRSGSTVTVKTYAEELVLNGTHSFAYRNNLRTLLTAFDREKAGGYGVTLEGGPAEVVLEGGRAKVTVHGPSGVRQIRLPGKWTVPEGTSIQEGVIRVPFKGGNPLRINLAAAVPEVSASTPK
jgi:hypothetical protein